MIHLKNEIKLSRSELISPILSNKLKTESFLSKKQDDLELLELLKADILNLKPMNKGNSQKKMNNPYDSKNDENFPLTCSINLSQKKSQESLKGKLKDSLITLKNDLYLKSSSKKSKPIFFYESGFKKLKNIHGKLKCDLKQDSIELKKETNFQSINQNSLIFNKDIILSKNKKNPYNDVYQKTKVILDNKLNQLKNKLIMHNQNLSKIFKGNSPDQKLINSSRNKQYFDNDLRTNFLSQRKIRSNKEKLGESNPEKINFPFKKTNSNNNNNVNKILKLKNK